MNERTLSVFVDESGRFRHPDAGELVRGSGGIRKIRCAASGRGKRGGARTLYYWDVPDKIYMIFCYLKNELEDITPAQLKTLRKLVEENLEGVCCSIRVGEFAARQIQNRA